MRGLRTLQVHFITLEKNVKGVDVQHKEQINKESVENSIYAGIGLCAMLLYI